MRVFETKLTDIKPYDRNAKIHPLEQIKNVAESIKQFGFVQPIVIDKNGEIIIGHCRFEAAKYLELETVPCVRADELADEQVKALRIVDNKTNESPWDYELLQTELDEISLEGFEFDFVENELDEIDLDDLDDSQEKQQHTMMDIFIVPPFSVLDSRQGYWRKRKAEWNEKIGDDVTSRGTAKARNNGDQKGTQISRLDPVLCEVIMKWFFPIGGKTAFDCFSGDTAFGFVSSTCGAEFTGIELREEQCEFNQKRVDDNRLNARYICDDGRNVCNHIKAESQDLFFSCPPYFNLEIYSNKPNDASNQPTYEEFYKILDEAFSNAAKCLKNNRFAVVVVGDVRNQKSGEYYGFVEDVKRTFKNNGLVLYNEMILLEQIGRAILGAKAAMKNRKVVKTHQNVLVFYKGDTAQIKNDFAPIEYDDEELQRASENE